LETARIAGVVVLFQPPELALQYIESYGRELGVLYVFDNSPGQSVGLVTAIRQLRNVKYLTMGRNVGIAAALNTAARRALEEGYDYLLTMDQDSAAKDDMLSRMLEHIGDVGSLGLIAPFHQDRNAPKPIPGSEIEEIQVAMSSGSLLNLKAYEAVGGFMDKLFIDYVDTEYCLRLREHGYRIVQSNKAILTHSLGNFTARRFLGRTVYPYNHSPVRLYYQSRNRFFLRRLYGRTFPAYFRYDLKLFFGGIVKILLYERMPLKKLSMIVRGLLAFWRDDFSIVQISEH
jgi:rhamnosyltransferase